ncbi:hypothetical protein Athai_61570 [Actinocatenispora thailandica]|uniref:Uncharacterized protein n=1 Tax=Actinocatenispora thailandica TaxID=227318 RepID=A0A7R7DVJ0_9ACTN|nr:hypothetical protein [Actinocatenispora thailandica]BCJ38654.1 hypothetical protein Athai_61570 [Actinocatenispora thailandica]
MNATNTAPAGVGVAERGRHSATATVAVEAPPGGTESVSGTPAGPDVPEGVVDALLWRDAQYVLNRHRPDGSCCGYCGEPSPCTATRLATRAASAARTPLRSVGHSGQWRVVTGVTSTALSRP